VGLRAAVGELVDSRTSDASTDRGPQWILYSVLLVVVVVASAAALSSASGVRRDDVGLSGMWQASTIQTTVEATLTEILVKQQLAAWLVAENTLTGVTGTGDMRVDEWTGAQAVADALTSEVSRKALGQRLLLRARDADVRIRTLLTRIERDGSGIDPEQDAVVRAAVAEARQATERELASWFDEMLPEPALVKLLTNGTNVPPPVTAARDAVRCATFVLFWSTRPDELILQKVAQSFEPRRLDDAVTRAALKDFSARLIWTVAGVLFTTAALIAVFGGFARVRGLTRAWGRVILVALAALAAGLGAAAAVPPLGASTILTAIREFNEWYGLRLDLAAQVFNGLAAAAIVSLLAASWASFLTVADDDTFSSRVTTIRLKLQTLRWSLDAGTALLVAGVLVVFTRAQWPAAFAADTVATAITSAATSSAIAVGVFFSAILLLLYVPGARMLRDLAADEVREFNRLANEAGTPDDRKKEALAASAAITAALTDNGLDTQPLQQVGRFAQALLPLLISATLGPVIALATS
jgi:hypothetical protein